MKLKLCQTCKRPFLETDEFCKHCPPPYDADSFANLGCILLMVAPLFLFIVFWLFFFFGISFTNYAAPHRRAMATDDSLTLPDDLLTLPDDLLTLPDD